MNDKPLIDARTIKTAELPQCPMGCERKYLNLVRKQPLEDGNFSPNAVDFVWCAKCDFDAPIRMWKKLPGIYGGSLTAVVVQDATVNSVDELRNLRTRFWYLVDLLTVKGTLSPQQKADILEAKE